MGNKICPYCGEEIKTIAIKCKHCGSMLTDGPPSNHSLTGIHLVNHALGDRYEILEEIGRGGMATVYKAIQKSLERTVALKVVHQNLLHDTEFVARFHREAKLCASLNHPNIVTVYDEGEVSGVHFMAMEYLEGTDLHRLIRNRGRLTPQQTLQYLLPVAEALDYAHGKGYIHRDIKSANIFITGSGRVVLMDFGIAHAAVGTQLTRAGTVIGTPEYMSPEQAEGKKVDHRTDLYSLGVVMYECLAGRVPFSGENAMSTIFQLTRSEPDDKPLGQTPASIRQLMTALLRKKPENRPADARSVAEGISLLQKGKAWPGVKQSLRPDDKRKTTDHTIRVGGGGIGGDEPPSAQPRAARRKTVSPVVWVLLLIGVALGGVLINYVVTENQQQQEAQLEQSAWQQAERRNTIEAYDQYLSEYPRGRYVELAKAAIKKKQKEAEEEAEREQKERARIEERRIEEQRREEERKAQEAERQKEQEAAAKTYLIFKHNKTGETVEYPASDYPWDDPEWMAQWSFKDQRRVVIIPAQEEAKRRRQLPEQKQQEEEARRKNEENRKFEQASSGTFKDTRDNQTYKWVRIGNQVWMAENLNYNAGSGSWCYDNSTSNCNTYGRLYNWETALNACPPGWRLPSDEEWTQLTDFVGSDAGTKLKAKSGWQARNGTDDYRFSALPSGGRWWDGKFSSLGPGGGWWTSTEASSALAWGRSMSSSSGGVFRSYNSKTRGFSLRCIWEP